MDNEDTNFCDRSMKELDYDSNIQPLHTKDSTKALDKCAHVGRFISFVPWSYKLIKKIIKKFYICYFSSK